MIEKKCVNIFTSFTMFSPASAFPFPHFSVLSSNTSFVPARLAITFEEIFSTQGEFDTKKGVQC